MLFNPSRLLCLLLLIPALPTQADQYFPDRGTWERIEPREAGFDPQKLAAAVKQAQAKAVTEPQDLHQVLLDTYTDREPNYRVLGPTKNRDSSAGLVIRKGRIAAEWGDLERVDMTFSVVKSYLSTLVATALEERLITDVRQPVGRLVREAGYFDSTHNQKITWHHLLNQTSDWSGELWETYDWADRPEGDDPDQWPNRALNEPGTYYKYNDVRVNLLAYSLLQVYRRPLPEVLKQRIMDPIGASSTWRWHGYHNSWVELDGQKIQSVSGGGHFGGGLFINTLDHARFGLLFLRDGRWQDQQLVDPDWIGAARAPTPVREDYGYMWWLNTARERVSSAPESAFFAAGFGGNYIFIDQENDLLVILRWIPELEEVVNAFYASIDE